MDSVVNGIGWRWGIGMFAILMPFCASFIVVTLIYFGRKSRKAGLVVKKRLTLYDYCSLIDLGGMILLLGGFVMLLLPFCLAATTPSQWKTAYLDALIGVGAVFLVSLDGDLISFSRLSVADCAGSVREILCKASRRAAAILQEHDDRDVLSAQRVRCCMPCLQSS